MASWHAEMEPLYHREANAEYFGVPDDGAEEAYWRDEAERVFEDAAAAEAERLEQWHGPQEETA